MKPPNYIAKRQVFADLDDPEVQMAYSPIALIAFQRIMETWTISQAERRSVLGSISATEYQKLMASETPKLSAEALERISLTLGIYRALKLLFLDECSRTRWFLSPNSDAVLSGKSPKDLVVSGSKTDLRTIRQHLESMLSEI